MLKRNGILTVLLSAVISLPAFGAMTIDGDKITFPDASTQSTAATGGGGGDLTNVTTVQAAGTNTENGTALKAAMDAISGANTTPTVIQLAAGTYDLGATTLTMKPNTKINGVGVQVSIITGQGSVIVDGDENTLLRDLQVLVTAGSTGIRITGADKYLECFRVVVNMLPTGAVDAVGVEASAGGELDLTSCYLTSEGDNSGGSLTGLFVDGTDSAAYVENSGFDMVELSDDGAITGIYVDAGGEVDVDGGDHVVERDAESSLLSALSSVTGFEIEAGTRLTLKNLRLNTDLYGSDDESSSVSILRASGSELTAFSVWFRGTIPAAVNNGAGDSVTYIQSSGDSGDL